MIALWAVVIAPFVCAVVAVLLPRPRAVFAVIVAGSLIEAGLVAALAPAGLAGRVFAAHGHLSSIPCPPTSGTRCRGLRPFVVLCSRYFAPRLRSGELSSAAARRFGAAWFAFLGSMVLVLTTNNLGLMWVGMEATTLASVVLICFEFDREAVRASWTYLIICSVGIALALLGTFLFCAEAKAVAPGNLSPFLWTDLTKIAPAMRPAAAKLAFLFLLVGYGTKAGLAPMHTWLPDAHSQAPAPVSAVLSGVLLNCAMYAISRFLPLAEAATGSTGWPFRLLIPFGLISIGLAAAFIVHEHDIKRLLAYHSVEHMGIIALGLGAGGVAAALFHTLNHSVCKMLTFFCAGDLVEHYGTRDMRRMGGILRSDAVPLAGAGLVLGILVLVGAPPFSIFMSELWIVRSGLGAGHALAVFAFLGGAAIVFVAAIEHVVGMLWQRPDTTATPRATGPRTRWFLVVLPLALLLLVGVWMPAGLGNVLTRAAGVIGGGR